MSMELKSQNAKWSYMGRDGYCCLWHQIWLSSLIFLQLIHLNLMDHQEINTVNSHQLSVNTRTKLLAASTWTKVRVYWAGVSGWLEKDQWDLTTNTRHHPWLETGSPFLPHIQPPVVSNILFIGQWIMTKPTSWKLSKFHPLMKTKRLKAENCKVDLQLRFQLRRLELFKKKFFSFKQDYDRQSISLLGSSDTNLFASLRSKLCVVMGT